MLDVIDRAGRKTEPKLMERLRASREEFFAQARSQGSRYGRSWLEQAAGYEQLERLWCFHEKRKEDSAAGARPLGSAEVYLAIHPETSSLHEESRQFWSSVVGVADELLRNQGEFLDAFMESAVADWPAIKERLDAGI